MTFKTPQFWYPKDTAKSSWLTHALAPLSCVYGAIQRRRHAEPYACGIPVICIGNAVAGGSGKTPTALAVMEHIKRGALAKNPVFLTRGYGGTLNAPTLIDTAIHTALETGDEALLLARAAPAIVSADRIAGALLAQEHKADLIIMDDGFQNHSLHKDLNILVIDGETGFGNGKLLPAGPLREPAADALARADLVMMIGDNQTNITTDKPVISGHITPEKPESFKARYLAFAGLARPEKFFKTLYAHNIDVIETHSFPDHHRYTDGDITSLQSRADDLGATLITTAKDAVKLPDYTGEIFDITLEFDDKNDTLNSALKALLS
jgi:tetraacyldisaccharide 4'-kinase